MTSQPLYLGVDPGLACTALVILDARGKYQTCNLIQSMNSRKSMSVGYIYRQVQDKVAPIRHKIALAGIERQYLGANRTFKSVAGVVAAAAVVQAALQNLEIDIVEVHPSQWQRYLKLGKSPKRAQIKAASKMLAAQMTGVLLSSDGADAFFLGLAALEGVTRKKGRKGGRYAGW